MSMEATFLLVTEEEFPDGICCIECERQIDNGQPYSEFVEGFVGENILVTFRCVYC